MNSYSTSWRSLLLIDRPREDERLSWPCWLTYSGRLTHKVIIRPASSQAQDGESSPVKDQRSTTVLRHHRDVAAIATTMIEPCIVFSACNRCSSHLQISITNFTSSQALSRYAIVPLRRYVPPSRGRPIALSFMLSAVKLIWRGRVISREAVLVTGVSQSPNKIWLTWVKYDVTGDLKST